MIRINGLSKHFGEVVALRDISLVFESGSITALHGPSGSGKTTLLRLIAGLEIPTAGEIRIDGARASSASTMLAPHERGIGFAFQDAALWPHVTVYQNVAFGLLGRPRQEVAGRVEEVLVSVGLSDLARRYPNQLSGGQARRVSLARTLVTRPQRLLLDEPLTHIHPELRTEILGFIKKQAAREGMTVLYVTHALAEAEQLGGRLIRIVDGAIADDGAIAGDG
jgi:ABC-type sulfate/molybdate transport systems ATPase subunit